MQITGQNSGVVADYRLTLGSVLRIPRAGQAGCQHCKIRHILQIVGGDAPSMLVVGGGLQTPHRLRMLNVRTEILPSVE